MTDWSKGDQLLFFENLTDFECQILVVWFLVIHLGLYYTFRYVNTFAIYVINNVR